MFRIAFQSIRLRCNSTTLSIINNNNNNNKSFNSIKLFSTTTKLHEAIGKPVFLTGPNRSTDQRRNSQKVTPFGWILLLIPISTFGLGCWQVQRKKWKESLIKQVETQIRQEPVEFPENIEELNEMEYRAIRVRGEFLHDHELYVGPRPLRNVDGETSPGLMTTKGSFGYHVITPFKLENQDHIILINRGWVPKEKLNPIHRQNGQSSDVVELIGVVRKGEHRPPFAPKSNSERHAFSNVKQQRSSEPVDTESNVEKSKRKCNNHRQMLADSFIFRDLPRMCAMTGAEPYFLDATEASTIDGGPIGGQTQVQLRNEHFSYIVTWYSLSAFTSFMWYKRILLRGR